MSSERLEDRRQKAQERLTKAQDQWLAAVQKYGRNSNHPSVQAAREELETARLNYLNLPKATKSDSG